MEVESQWTSCRTNIIFYKTLRLGEFEQELENFILHGVLINVYDVCHYVVYSE